ncbi:MAG: phospholipid/cholesterol/gamma-HCH transport system substrate-binding protein [Pseudomonadota bacterium]|jgi:phospholipid/cholesterol/gamma-HCH transport system substrate-binding protein|nr:phospholipid/cholesterol/gamma-HCH transport system substrate-binding protein [Pseudomonadota bacterium]
MESNRPRELGTGLFVFLGFAALLFLATQTTDLDEYAGDEGYRVTARFEDVAGLKVRSQVTMSGVNIGRVERIEFDNERLDAVVTLRVNSQFNRIPDDSDASILTAGLLGSKYVGIGAGGSDTWLTEGSELQITQSAVVLEQLIGKFLFSKAEEGDTTASPSVDE